MGIIPAHFNMNIFPPQAQAGSQRCETEGRTNEGRRKERWERRTSSGVFCSILFVIGH